MGRNHFPDQTGATLVELALFLGAILIAGSALLGGLSHRANASVERLSLSLGGGTISSTAGGNCGRAHFVRGEDGTQGESSELDGPPAGGNSNNPGGDHGSQHATILGENRRVQDQFADLDCLNWR